MLWNSQPSQFRWGGVQNSPQLSAWTVFQSPSTLRSAPFFWCVVGGKIHELASKHTVCLELSSVLWWDPAMACQDWAAVNAQDPTAQGPRIFFPLICFGPDAFLSNIVGRTTLLPEKKVLTSWILNSWLFCFCFVLWRPGNSVVWWQSRPKELGYYCR